MTRPVQVVAVVCSVVFAVSSAVHGFVVIDASLIETMMRAADVPDPAHAAPGFTVGFRLVGSVYVVANAVGVLAWWSRSGALWWWLLAVNATQGLGYLMIPSEMWTAVIDRYGLAGTLPSLVTDGSAALLAVAIIGATVRYRTTWAQHRAQPNASSPPATAGT